MVNALVEFVRSSLEQLADPEKAVPMAAYMKTDMPFYGVTSGPRRKIGRELRDRFPPGSNAEYRTQVETLWTLEHREEKYLAIGVARDHREFIRFDNLDLYERLIREGAWWDFVDEIAAHLIGEVLAAEPERINPVLEQWIDDPFMWIRRTAILAQLGRKQDTDEDMLFRFAARRADETEFFIRKAIGWALRDYARTNPDAVRAFLKTHELSGLSRREASKHL